LISLALISQNDILALYFIWASVILNVLTFVTENYPHTKELNTEVKNPNKRHISSPDIAVPVFTMELLIEKWHRYEVNKSRRVFWQIEQYVKLAQFKHEVEFFLERICFSLVILEEVSIVLSDPDYQLGSRAVNEQHKQTKNESQKIPNSHLLSNSRLSLVVFIIIVADIDFIRSDLSLGWSLGHRNHLDRL